MAVQAKQKPKKGKKQQYCSIGQASKMLGVSIATLRRWEKAGKIKAVRLDGKNRSFKVSELEKLSSTKPLSTAATAKQLKVSESSVRRLQQSGQLVGERGDNGKYLFSQESIDAYKQAKVAKKASKPAEPSLAEMIEQEAEKRLESAEDFLEHDNDGYISPAEIPHPFLSGILAAVATIALLITPWKNIANMGTASTEPVSSNTSASVTKPAEKIDGKNIIDRTVTGAKLAAGSIDIDKLSSDVQQLIKNNRVANIFNNQNSYNTYNTTNVYNTTNNNGGNTISAGTGISVTLNGNNQVISADYGSQAGTAAEGNKLITCPTGTGNLTGGGNSVAVGAGGTCDSLGIINNPTFTGQVTAGSLTSGGAITFSALGTGLVRSSVTGALSTNFVQNSDFDSSQIYSNLTKLNNVTIGGQLTVSGLANGIVKSTAGILSGGNTVSLGSDTTGSYIQNLGTLTGLNTTGNSGAGSTPTLAVAYGSTANTSVQGNTTLICPSGTGNLTGTGNTITLGSGGTCNSLGIVDNPTFTGLMTSLGVNAGSGSIQGTGGLAVTGNSSITGNLSTTGTINTATISGGTLSGGNVSGGTMSGGTFTGGSVSGGSLTTTSVNGLSVSSGTISSPTITTPTITGGLTVSSGGASITGNSSITGTLTGLTGLTVASGGASITGGINNNSGGITNTGIINGATGITSSGTITFSGLLNGFVKSNAGILSGGNTVSLGSDTTGSYIQSLGTLTGLNTTGNSGAGSTPTLAVAYGSTANTSVQGNTTLICPSGTGNLTGTGNTITLGSGGTCNSLGIVDNPTFTGLMTSLGVNAGSGSIQGTGGLAVTGNSSITGILDVSGNLRVNTNKFTVASSTGNTSVAGTLGVVGNLNINTNKFNVLAASGNTSIAGTLSVSGDTLISPTTNSANAFRVQNSTGGNIFTVDTTNEKTIISSPTSGVGTIATPDINSSGESQSMLLITGNGDVAGGGSGAVQISSGNGYYSGGIAIYTGSASNGSSGNVTIDAGGVNAGWSAGIIGIGGNAALVELSSPTSVYSTLYVQSTASFNSALNVTGGASISLGINNNSGGITNTGALSGISGYTQTLGDFSISGSGTFSTGTGNVSINGATTVKPAVNSTTAFRIQNAAGTSNIIVADSSNIRIGIGASPANSTLTVGTNTTAASGGIYFGTDTNLYRLASGRLQSDGSLKLTGNAGGASLQTTQGMWNQGSTATGTGIYLGVSGDVASSRLSIRNDGRLLWGDGTVNPGDTVLYRSSAGVLKTDTSLTIAGNTTLAPTTDSTTLFKVQNAAGSSLLNVDSSTTSNLLTNGDLESSTNSTAVYGWSTVGTGTTFQQTTPFWQGKYALSVSATAGNANGGAANAYTFAANTTYTLSFYARVPSGTITDLVAGRQDVSGTDITCLTGQTLTTTYTRFTCTFTTGATITNSNIFIQRSSTAAETFLIDGVQLQLGSSASTFTVGGAPQFSFNTSRLQVMNSAGTSAYLAVDTVANRINVGGTLITTAANVSPDGAKNGTAIILDPTTSASNVAAISMTNGSTYRYALRTAYSGTAFDVYLGDNQTALVNSVVLQPGSSGYAGVDLPSTSGTQTNGFWVNRSAAGGTTTNMVNIQNSAGTATNALTFTGTFTNLISSTNFNVSNAGVLSLAGGQSRDITSNNAIVIGPQNTSSGNGKGLTLHAGATSDLATGGTLALNGGNSTGGFGNGGAVTITGGAATITTGTGGAVNINGGSGITASGSINIGTSTTNQVTLGASGTNTRIYVGSTQSTNGLCADTTNASSYKVIYDCSGTPSDYAESYPVAQGIVYGDIVVTSAEMVNTYALRDKNTQNEGDFDWSKPIGRVSKLVKASSAYQSSAIGVVSDNYHDFTSAGRNIKDEDNPMPVALNGRVPVNMASDSESVSAGDYITTSGTQAGKGTKATSSGYVIGKALENWSSGQSQLMVFIEPGYYSGPTISSYVQDGGSATLVNLTVNGTLEVKGLLKVADIEVNGHIITKGSTPQISAKAAAGGSASVSIDGNDTSGTITITAGSGASAGDLAEVTFSKVYGAKPRVILSASNDKAAKLQLFKSASTSGFVLKAADGAVPVDGSTYEIDYQIMQ